MTEHQSTSRLIILTFGLENKSNLLNFLSQSLSRDHIMLIPIGDNLVLGGIDSANDVMFSWMDQTSPSLKNCPVKNTRKLILTLWHTLCESLWTLSCNSECHGHWYHHVINTCITYVLCHSWKSSGFTRMISTYTCTCPCTVATSSREERLH